MIALFVFGGLGLGILQTVRLIWLTTDLKEIIRDSERRRARVRSRCLVSDMRTTYGETLRALLNQENVKSLGMMTRERSEGLPNQVPPFFRGLSREEIVQLLLNDLIDRFSADSVAILVRAGDSPLRLLQIHRGGARGDRFRQVLIARFESYFSRGDQSFFGRTEHCFERTLTSDLSFFGFDFSLSGPVTSVDSLVLWLGFEDLNHGTADLTERFHLYLGDVERQFQEYDRVCGLQEQYALERKKSEERGRLLAYAAHDMSAPINSIKMTLQVLGQQELSEDSQKSIQSMLASCEMLGEIVDDAKDVSLFRAGLLRVETTEAKCSELVERVCRTFQQLACDKGLTLTRSVPHYLRIRADQRQVARILSNVIGNAIKYTVRGSVSVSAKAHGEEHVVIAVKDSGIGMSADQVERMYEPYTRFSEQGIDGLGLGLALSKVFADLNRCTLETVSVPAEGTIVSLTLPGRVIEDNHFIAEEREIGRRILIADDHDQGAISLGRILKTHGFEVQVATSLADARSIISLSEPEFVITDLSFSDGIGEELIRFVRRKRRDATVIILSGRDLQTEHRDILNWPGVFYQRKPATIPVLLGYLGRHCLEVQHLPTQQSVRA